MRLSQIARSIRHNDIDGGAEEKPERCAGNKRVARSVGTKPTTRPARVSTHNNCCAEIDQTRVGLPVSEANLSELQHQKAINSAADLREDASVDLSLAISPIP